MERRYQGVLKFKRFFGVKAGRSIWKESFVKTHVYTDPLSARSELCCLACIIFPADCCCYPTGYFLTISRYILYPRITHNCLADNVS